MYLLLPEEEADTLRILQVIKRFSGMIYGDDIFYLWKIHSAVITNK